VKRSRKLYNLTNDHLRSQRVNFDTVRAGALVGGEEVTFRSRSGGSVMGHVLRVSPAQTGVRLVVVTDDNPTFEMVFVIDALTPVGVRTVVSS
jgi:hypothetical protein